MKPTRLKISNLIALATILLLSACTNLEKVIDQGNYDQAVAIAAKRLKGKTKKKAKYVAALEEGFRKATARDMSRMESLKRINTADSWQKVHNLALDIEYRQNLIAPLLPIIDKEGYKANFKFVKTSGLISESGDRAANLLYDEARAHLAQGRNGNKQSARAAYQVFQKINRFDTNYKDVIALKNEAHQLGTVHIRYRVNNHSNGHIPRVAVDRLRNINTNELNTFWEKYYLGTAGNGVTLDYELNLNVQRIDMGPELINEREFTEKKEVIIGYNTVVEKNEISTDSLSREEVKDKETKVPKYQWVSAEVLRIIQKRDACVHANIEVRDLRTGGIVNRKQLSSKIAFENCYIEFFGDQRALSNETRRHLNNRPLPFPSDRKMLTDAACQMAPQVKDQIRYMNLS